MSDLAIKFQNKCYEKWITDWKDNLDGILRVKDVWGNVAVIITHGHMKLYALECAMMDQYISIK